MSLQEDIKFDDNKSQSGVKVSSNGSFDNLLQPIQRFENLQQPTNTEYVSAQGNEFSDKEEFNTDPNASHDQRTSQQGQLSDNQDFGFNFFEDSEFRAEPFHQENFKDLGSIETHHKVSPDDKPSFFQPEVPTRVSTGSSTDNPQPDFWITFDDSFSHTNAIPEFEPEESDPFQYDPDGGWEEGNDAFSSIGMSTASSFLELEKRSDSLPHVSNDLLSPPTFEAHSESTFNAENLDSKITNALNDENIAMDGFHPNSSHDKFSIEGIFHQPVTNTANVMSNVVSEQLFSKSSNVEAPNSQFLLSEQPALPSDKETGHSYDENKVSEKSEIGTVAFQPEEQGTILSSSNDAEALVKGNNQARARPLEDVTDMQKHVDSLMDKGASMHELHMDSKISSDNIEVNANSKKSDIFAKNSNKILSEDTGHKEASDNQEGHQENALTASSSNKIELHAEPNSIAVSSKDEQKFLKTDNTEQESGLAIHHKSVIELNGNGSSSGSPKAFPKESDFDVQAINEIKAPPHQHASSDFCDSGVTDTYVSMLGDSESKSPLHKHASSDIFFSGAEGTNINMHDCTEKKSQSHKFRKGSQNENGQGLVEDQGPISNSKVFPDTSFIKKEDTVVSSESDFKKGNGNVVNFSEDAWATGDGLKYPEPALWEQLLENEVVVAPDQADREDHANTAAPSNPFMLDGAKGMEGLKHTPTDGLHNTDPNHPTASASQSSGTMKEYHNSEGLEFPVKEEKQSGSENQFPPTSEIKGINADSINGEGRPSGQSKNPFDEEFNDEGIHDQVHQTKEVPLECRDSHASSQPTDISNHSEKSDQRSGLSWQPILSLNRTRAPAKKMMDSVWNSPAKLPSPKSGKEKFSIKSLWNMCTCCNGPAT